MLIGVADKYIFMKHYFIKIALFVAAAFAGIDAHSQDLIASQAPVDRKLKSVDSLALHNQMQIEQSLYPGSDIYPNWDNEFVQAYKDAVVPESFTVDLRGFCMPTDHTKITDIFGYRPRRRRSHYGLDIKVYVGDTIRAAFSGRVRVVKNQGRQGYGKYIVIRHDNGLETVYGHLSKQLVKVNDLVKAGDVIGLGGNTGRSTGSHLHFETRFLGIAINPALMFDFEKQDVVADSYTIYPKSKGGKRTSTGGNNNAQLAEGQYHKIKQGDTLSKIAAKYGISVNQLCRLNNITTKTILRVGSVLKLS